MRSGTGMSCISCSMHDRIPGPAEAQKALSLALPTRGFNGDPFRPKSSVEPWMATWTPFRPRFSIVRLFVDAPAPNAGRVGHRELWSRQHM